MVEGSIVNILMVEDNPADVEFTRESLKDSKLFIDFVVLDNGGEVLPYLRKEGKYVNAKTPDLILLDLNLPKKDGKEILTDIKGDANLKRLPVVVLTTSKQEIDILKSYNIGANCFITKPVKFEKFAEVVKEIESFWFTIVKLPGKPNL